MSNRHTPRRQTRRLSRRERSVSLNVRWSGLRPIADPQGAPYQRFYQLESLASGTEGLLHGRDRFIVPSIQQQLGPSPVSTLHFTLMQESSHRLVFRLQAANARGRRGAFAFIVAKREEEMSELIAAEHQNLRQVHRRSPEDVMQTYLGGPIVLPGKARRKRTVYAFLGQWLTGFHELGLDRDGRLMLNVMPHQLLSKEQEEAVKARLVTLMARTWDAKGRTAIAVPEPAQGELLATKPKRGAPRLVLTGCRKLVGNLTPERLVGTLARATWKWGRLAVPLAPTDPGRFIEALERGRGRDEARLWLEAYRAAVEAGRIREGAGLPVAALDEAL